LNFSCRKKSFSKIEVDFRIFDFFSGPAATERLLGVLSRALKGPAKFTRPLRGLR
jgi:hypothetical protein